MKKETLLLELEKLVEQAGYSIRKEKGTFRGDSCVMEGQKLVVLNKKKTSPTASGVVGAHLKRQRVTRYLYKAGSAQASRKAVAAVRQI